MDLADTARRGLAVGAEVCRKGWLGGLESADPLLEACR